MGIPGKGGMEIVDPERSNMERCRVLMKKYRDLPMDLADAALVAAGESRKNQIDFYPRP